MKQLFEMLYWHFTRLALSAALANGVINDPKVNMQSQLIKFVGVKMMKHL